MREYGLVYVRFWESLDIAELSDDGRLLALYLLTGPHTTLAGIYRMPYGYVAEDLRWSSERVAKGFEELSKIDFVRVCNRSKWIWITRYLVWNWPENPNQYKAALKLVEQIPTQCEWRENFINDFKQLTEQRARGEKPFRNPSATLSYSGSGSGSGTGTGTGTGFRSPNGSHAAGGGESKRKPNGATSPAGHKNGHDPNPLPIEPEGFIHLRAIYPERSGSQRWADALEYYLGNLKAGYTEAQMLEGVQRYAAYCEAEGIVGQVCVQAAATFLGRNHGFLDAWEPRPPEGRLSPTEKWLREQEANDAKH